MSITRLFDTNLNAADGWTEGDASWDDCNPVQDLNGIYHRYYGESADDDIVNYRLERGDKFFIGSAPDKVKDWTPRTTPWNFDIDEALKGAWFSFYFGVHKGENQINTSLKVHSPWIINSKGVFISLSADYHRFYSVKLKDSDPFLTLTNDVTGTEIIGAVMSNSGLIETNGYRMFDWVFEGLTFIKTFFKMLDIPAGSSNVSTQNFDVTGVGDIGMVIRSGHSEMQVVGGTIKNEDHEYSDNGELLIGLEIETGDLAYVRYINTEGFSGHGFKFDCPVDVKGLNSTHDGLGIEFGEDAIADSCMVSWTRRLDGESFAYSFAKNGQLNNSGCNLDETIGLGVVVGHEGSVITINGGDYRALAPLPFAYGKGACTFVLNKVKINGTVYNETINLTKGESWRGVKATVVLDALPVYANKTLVLPYLHIPQLKNAISVQGAENAFASQIDMESGARIVPTGDGSLRYMPLDAWLHLDPGESAIDFFRYSTETFIYMHQFQILPSPEVGAKVVGPDGFSGSGFSQFGEVYTANETTGSLSASYAFEQGEVYQISLKLTNCEGGTITPSISGESANYNHSREGTEVWLIRAPNNANSIELNTNSLTSEVSNIYVRKLLRTATPSVPELEAFADSGNMVLKWRVWPKERLSTRNTPDVHISNQELAQNDQDGYRSSNADRHYFFENVTVNEKRNGVNLRGAKSLEITGMVFRGGYGQNLAEGETLDDDYPYSTWQTACAADLNGPYCEVQQLLFNDIDLQLDSNYGNYTSTFGNSDCVVVNNAYSGSESLLYTAHFYGNEFRNGSDAVTDCKKRTEINYCEYEGACKMLRTHARGSATVANTSFVRTAGVREVFFPSHSSPYIEIWNSSVDNVRCVNTEQIKNQPKGFGTYSQYSPLRTRTKLVHVMHTYPTLDPLNDANMTDMEFEISTNNSTWSSLFVPDVGLPGIVGAFKRTLAISSGSYYVRCRCLNGGDIGSWSSSIPVTV